MLLIEETPEQTKADPAIKVFDHNGGKRGVNRYDQQFRTEEEKSFETTYSDGKSSIIPNGKQMDLKELEKTKTSESPVQIGDITYQDGSVESSLLISEETNQQRKMLSSAKR